MAAGTARRAKRLSVQGMNDGSCVHFSFSRGHRRDGGDFPGLSIGQQQLYARGGVGQQQQQHGSWNRHQPQFPVQQHHNQQHLPRYQQRSLPHRQQRFRPPLQQQHNQQTLPSHQHRSPLNRQQRFCPPSQHPHQRGGPKSGPGVPWDCGQNASSCQEESPVPANAPISAVPKCSRCGRIRHLASICEAPRWFEGNCAACGEYSHLCRFCVTTRRPIPMQPHANVVTASGGGNGDCSWDHVDGGSKV